MTIPLIQYFPENRRTKKPTQASSLISYWRLDPAWHSVSKTWRIVIWIGQTLKLWGSFLLYSENFQPNQKLILSNAFIRGLLNPMAENICLVYHIYYSTYIFLDESPWEEIVPMWVCSAKVWRNRVGVPMHLRFVDI